MSKPIYTTDDAKGLKIGAMGLWSSKLASAIGFSVVNVPAFAVYENIQKNIVDGSFCDPEMMLSYKIGELVKYWHGVCAQFVPFWFAINRDTWNSLSPDLQKVLEDATLKMIDRADPLWQKQQAATFELLPEVEIIDIAPEEQTKWRALQDPIQEEYMAELEATGVDAHKIFNKMNELFAQYAADK